METRNRRYNKSQPPKSDADDHNARHTDAIFGHIEKEAEALNRFFTDPLSDSTKDNRRNLLLTAFLSIILSTTGLLPKKISALGLELEDIDQMSLLIILLVTVVYFLITFLFYAYSDLIRTFWRTIYFFRVALPELEDAEMHIQHTARDFSKDAMENYKYEVADLRSMAKEARQAERELRNIHEKMEPIFRDIKWSNLRTLLKRIHVIRIAVDTALPSIVGLASIGVLIYAILKR